MFRAKFESYRWTPIADGMSYHEYLVKVVGAFKVTCHDQIS